MWSLINNNFICSELELFRVNKIHLEKLLNMKSSLNNKGPETPYFLKNKSYLRELIRSNELKRNYANNIIYKKLMHMANSPSPYSRSNIPKYCPAFDKQRFNFDKIEREVNIYNDNVSFYKRFSAKKSTYSTYTFNDFKKYDISKSKFLPQIALKMCTYRQFKSNLLKESNKIKERNKNLGKKNRFRNIILKLNRSKSLNDLINKKKYNFENLRYFDNNNNNNNKSFKNKSVNNNILLNSKFNNNSNTKSSKLKRSQSAINIKFKNGNNF